MSVNMKHAGLVLLTLFLVAGCDRDTFKRTNYSKPINEETINSTNGLDPNARMDTFEGRPPSESLGVKGSSGGGEIQSAAETEQNRNTQQQQSDQ